MSRYVLSMILFGGLLGGGLIGGSLLPGCGEESKPGGGGNGGATEGEGDTGEGEGEGSPNEGEGSTEGEGEGPRPPGADGEPCGAGSTCRDGLECGAEEAGVCTCPQILAGTWWAEFPEVRRTDGQAYDFMAPGLDQQFWEDQEIAFEQDGCAIRCKDSMSIWSCYGSGSIDPPNELNYKMAWDMEDNREHLLRSSGQISEDEQSINGTCAGEYLDWGRLTLFPITCTFTLTRRE